MTTFIRDLTPDQIPAELGDKAQLRIRLYYHKEGKRGLKLSITRCSIEGMFSRCLPFSSYNGSLHLLDMKRKNDKVLNALSDKIEAVLDQIIAISLASETPNWQEIYPLLEDH